MVNAFDCQGLVCFVNEVPEQWTRIRITKVTEKVVFGVCEFHREDVENSRYLPERVRQFHLNQISSLQWTLRRITCQRQIENWCDGVGDRDRTLKGQLESIRSLEHILIGNE